MIESALFKLLLRDTGSGDGGLGGKREVKDWLTEGKGREGKGREGVKGIEGREG